MNERLLKAKNLPRSKPSSSEIALDPPKPKKSFKLRAVGLLVLFASILILFTERFTFIENTINNYVGSSEKDEKKYQETEMKHMELKLEIQKMEVELKRKRLELQELQTKIRQLQLPQREINEPKLKTSEKLPKVRFREYLHFYTNARSVRGNRIQSFAIKVILENFSNTTDFVTGVNVDFWVDGRWVKGRMCKDKFSLPQKLESNSPSSVDIVAEIPTESLIKSTTARIAWTLFSGNVLNAEFELTKDK